MKLAEISNKKFTLRIGLLVYPKLSLLQLKVKLEARNLTILFFCTRTSRATWFCACVQTNSFGQWLFRSPTLVIMVIIAWYKQIVLGLWIHSHPSVFDRRNLSNLIKPMTTTL